MHTHNYTAICLIGTNRYTHVKLISLHPLIEVRGEAYLVLSFEVGPFVQEHLDHFHMTPPSGEMESSFTILSETDTHSERETPRDG